jgi:hypothetical protein
MEKNVFLCLFSIDVHLESKKKKVSIFLELKLIEKK